MLRIKEEVDLKELEKFGFHLYKNTDDIMESDKVAYAIFYFESYRKFDGYITYDIVINYGGTISNERIINIKVENGFQNNFETLYDLINANIVEKSEVKK